MRSRRLDFVYRGSARVWRTEHLAPIRQAVTSGAERGAADAMGVQYCDTALLYQNGTATRFAILKFGVLLHPNFAVENHGKVHPYRTYVTFFTRSKWLVTLAFFECFTLRIRAKNVLLFLL